MDGAARIVVEEDEDEDEVGVRQSPEKVHAA